MKHICLYEYSEAEKMFHVNTFYCFQDALHHKISSNYRPLIVVNAADEELDELLDYGVFLLSSGVVEFNEIQKNIIEWQLRHYAFPLEKFHCVFTRK